MPCADVASATTVVNNLSIISAGPAEYVECIEIIVVNSGIHTVGYIKLKVA